MDGVEISAMEKIKIKVQGKNSKVLRIWRLNFRPNGLKCYLITRKYMYKVWGVHDRNSQYIGRATKKKELFLNIE